MAVHVHHWRAPEVIQEQFLQRIGPDDITIRHDSRYVIVDKVTAQTVDVT